MGTPRGSIKPRPWGAACFVFSAKRDAPKSLPSIFPPSTCSSVRPRAAPRPPKWSLASQRGANATPRACAIDAIRARDLSRLGELCDLNHGLLASLGVSTQELDLACHIAREEGALGAKLTGAGGGGCVFAIVDAEEDRREAILTAWRARGLRCFATTLGARNQERD